MQIVEIVHLDKRRCRVCTDADVAFVLYKGELRRYRLDTGEELMEDTYREILETILCRRARERAMYLLKSHDRTEQEIRTKLRNGFYPEEAVDSAVAFLREYGFVDDMEYGRRYVEFYGQRRSRRRIRDDLARKGFARTQIEELLGEQEIPEEEQIRAFLARKGYDAAGGTPEQYRRIRAALLRRGYSCETVGRVMREK